MFGARLAREGRYSRIQCGPTGRIHLVGRLPRISLRFILGYFLRLPPGAGSEIGGAAKIHSVVDRTSMHRARNYLDSTEVVGLVLRDGDYFLSAVFGPGR